MRADYNILRANKLSGEKVVSWSEPFSMEQATRIKLVTRSSMNDVFMCVVAGSLRHFMRTRGVLHPYDMTAAIPVDMRSDGAKVAMGNYYSYVDLLIPTNTEGAIPRLWEIKHQMEDLKSSADAIVLYGMQWILSNVLPECLYQRIFQCIWNKSSCVIANVPGPDIRLQFASCEIRSMVSITPPPADIALSISVITYGDQVRLSVIADRNVMPNPHVITKQFNREVRKGVQEVSQ